MIIQKRGNSAKRGRLDETKPIASENVLPETNAVAEIPKILVQRLAVAGLLASLPFLQTFPASALDNQPIRLPSATIASFPSSSDDAARTANAGRLLMNNDVTRKRSVTADLAKQISMQDQRLSQCETAGEDWEQCFFYGTQAMFTTPPPQDEATKAYPQWQTPQPHGSIPSSSNYKIPTW